MKKTFVATGALLILVLSGLSVFAQSQSREDILKEIEAKRVELAALENRFLSPSEEDQATYANFLLQPETGLIRLLPREKYDSETYTENQKTLTVRGAGAYYSFTRRSHDYNKRSQISLEQGKFVSGFVGNDSGVFVNLGDVPLENINLETPASQALAATSAATITRQGRTELKLGSSYLLRSVTRQESDSLVAFRVVRLDSDGSTVILWRLLKSSPVKETAGNN